MDAVGLKFDIHPLFLSTHFGTGMPDDTRTKLEDIGTGTYTQLSSQTLSLELGHSLFRHASIVYLDPRAQVNSQQSTSACHINSVSDLNVHLLTYTHSLGPPAGSITFMYFSCSGVR